uniref:Uncharacterized protein n=1 Tax=Glossina brevipalpis TaxID=37001 RepID=A0A1A9W1V4_9MUSC
MGSVRSYSANINFMLVSSSGDYGVAVTTYILIISLCLIVVNYRNNLKILVVFTLRQLLVLNNRSVRLPVYMLLLRIFERCPEVMDKIINFIIIVVFNFSNHRRNSHEQTRDSCQ